MILRKCLIILFALCIVTNAYAKTPTLKPYTWHIVKTNDGIWDAQLQVMNESGSFVTPQGDPINKFVISPRNSQEYGFELAPDNDLNVAYSLVLTQRDTKNSLMFKSKACVFIVTSASVGKSDIRVLNYHDAHCSVILGPSGKSFVAQ